jgi:hypothetical protein
MLNNYLPNNLAYVVEKKTHNGPTVGFFGGKQQQTNKTKKN